MNVTDDTLIILGSYSRGYALMRRRLRGYTGPADFPRLKQSLDVKENTLRITLSRLKKRGLVQNRTGTWTITKQGRKYLEERLEKFLKGIFFSIAHAPYSKITHKNQRNMIVAFDIPEKQKNKRDWLRAELRNLGFIPLQKSVWFGPSPLSESFIKAIHELNILQCLKFFKASEYEIV